MNPINPVNSGETATSKLFKDYCFGGYSLGSYTMEGIIVANTTVSEMN